MADRALVVLATETTGLTEQDIVVEVAWWRLDTDERGQWGYADAYDSLQRDEDGTADVGASDAATEAFWDVVRDCAK